MRRKIPGNLLLGAGLLLTAAAILLGDAGLVGHGVKLAMLLLAIGLELWGGLRRCRLSGPSGPGTGTNSGR